MSPRTSRSFAALLALVAACVLSPAARAQAAGGTACWAMTPEERQKGSPSADIFTWYHNALESLKRSDPESVKKAIFNLRWCIVSKASSGGFVIAGNRVDRLEYYPYAHLGLAYSKLGNYPCAEAAFAYELEKQGKLQGGALYDEVQRARGVARELAAEPTMLALADELAKGAIPVSEKRRADLGQVRAASQELQSAPGPQKKSKLDALRQLAGRILKAELDEQAATLRQLNESRFKGAFTAKALQADACAYQQADDESRLAEKLKACAKEADRGVAAVRDWACEDVKQASRTLDQRLDQLRRWPCESVQPEFTKPALPEVCTAAMPRLSELEKVAGEQSDFKANIGKADAQIAGVRRRFDDRLKAASVTLPDDSQLAWAQSAKAKKDDLVRRQGQARALGPNDVPSKELCQLPDELARAQKELDAAIAADAEWIAKRRDCPELATAAHDRLSGLLGTFQANRGALTQLAQAAKEANDNYNACLVKNRTLLAGKLDEARAVMQAIAEWDAAAQPCRAGAAPLGCAEPARRALPASVGQDTASLQAAQRAFGEVEACRARFNEAVRRWPEAVNTLAERVQAMDRSAGALASAGASLPPASAAKLSSLGGWTKTALTRLQSVQNDVAQLGTAETAPNAEQIRRIAQGAVALGPLCAEQASYQASLGPLGALVELAPPFAALAKGDTDAAVRGLKDALARGQVADARGQAVARAALSYALFVKTLSTPPEAAELKGMLEKEAREHARAARTADPGFRPQAPLFPGAFADFFARQ